MKSNPLRLRGTKRFFGWPVFLVTWLPFGLGKLDCGKNRKILRNVGDAFDPERAPQETEGAYS
jgi:hypothetical protein